MRHPSDVLKELLSMTKKKPVDGIPEIPDDYERDRLLYEGGVLEFQDILLDNPLQPLAYAGIAYCKAKLDDSPRVVFDFFFAALQFNFSNPVVWSLVADYAKNRAEKNAWQTQTQNVDSYYDYKPLYDKSSAIEEESPPPIPLTRFSWHDFFMQVFFGIMAISLAGLLVVSILK